MPKIYGYTEILGDILVTGSFSVIGSASTINTTNLVVSDTIISLGHSQSGSPILDEGIMFGRGIGLTQAFIWDESDDTFALVSTNNDHTIIGDVNINSYSNLRVGGLTTSTIKISNGATNGYVLTSDVSGNATWQSLSSGVSGTGSTNYVPIWTGVNTLSSTSSIYDDGTKVGIGTNTPSYKLEVSGTVSSTGLYNNGGLRNKLTNPGLNAVYTITTNDYIVQAQPFGSFVTFSLPDSPPAGTEIVITKQSTGTVSVLRSGTNFINGGTSINWNPGVYGIARFIFIGGSWITDAA